MYGRLETALLLKEALQNSASSLSSARQVKIQSCCKVLTTLFTAARPSTIGPGNSDLKQEDKASPLYSII